MSVENALAHIRRMRSDETYRTEMNALSEDEEAAWAKAVSEGYEFTVAEFKEAQDVIYKEHGITPM